MASVAEVDELHSIAVKKGMHITALRERTGPLLRDDLVRDLSFSTRHLRRSLMLAGLLGLFTASAAIILFVRTAQREAIRLRAFGRLSQLHLSFAKYEAVHGELPPRHASDLAGIPTHSWFVFIQAEWPEINEFGSLDPAKSWQETAADNASPGANQVVQWFLRDGLLVCAFKDERSICEPANGFSAREIRHVIPVRFIGNPPDGVEWSEVA